MTVPASNSTELVQAELQDPAKRRWTDVLLLRYLNDAQRAIVLARPDAHSITEAVKLVVGTKQDLPAGGLRLLDASRNMGADGLTAGNAINFADREAQDGFRVNWHATRSSSVVDEIFYDYKRNPLVFYTSRPVASSPDCYIEICYSASPADVADVADDISLDDVYAPAINEWMLYRSFSINSATGSAARAAAHLQTFGNLLGVKMKVEQSVQPVPATEPR